MIGSSYGTITNTYFSQGPDNGLGTYESDSTNFYSNTHAVYDYGNVDGWESPPWNWSGTSYPTFD